MWVESKISYSVYVHDDGDDTFNYYCTFYLQGQNQKYILYVKYKTVMMRF